MVRLMLAAQYPVGIPLREALTKYKQAQSALGKLNENSKSIKSLDTKANSEESRSHGDQWESSNKCPNNSLNVPKGSVNFEKCDFCQKEHATTGCPKVTQLSALNLQQNEIMSEASEDFLKSINGSEGN